MEMVLESHQISADLQDEAPPPSYYASLHSNIKPTTLVSQQEQAPSTNWFVRDSADPSTWQLLTSGPLMSNVTDSHNNTTTYKRRYRIIYPPRKYEDVYLHRPPCTSQATAFPSHHVEVYSGRKRYNAEPLVILGLSILSADSQCLTNEAKALLSLHSPRAISAVEVQVTNMTRQATFAEMEFFSWDWRCKTAAANHDMRTMIMRAKEECARSIELVEGLDAFLAYVGGCGQENISIGLRRSCEEVGCKLERLRL